MRPESDVTIQKTNLILTACPKVTGREAHAEEGVQCKSLLGQVSSWRLRTKIRSTDSYLISMLVGSMV